MTMAEQFTYRIRWVGTDKEADLSDLSINDHGEHQAIVRSSAGGFAKLERYLAKAPGIRGYNVEKIGSTLMTVQEFIDYRRGE
jgi:hypothetical protein